MSAHEQFAEDLALYALGSLTGPEKQALEQHLESCVACRRELDALRGDTALLALSASGPAAPARSRERFLKAIDSERHIRTVPRRRSMFELLPAFGVAVLILISILLWRENVKLHRRLDYARAALTQNMAQTKDARELLDMLHDPQAVHVTLTTEHEPPHPYARAVYSPKMGHVVFMASTLGPLPQGKTYELWVVTMSGKPMPAGMFKPDAHGNAMVMQPCCPPGTEAKMLAVTIEPEGGSPAPTSTPLMTTSGS